MKVAIREGGAYSVIGGIAVAVLLSGCPKKIEEPVVEPIQEEVVKKAAETVRPTEPIYFDFDQSVIRADQKEKVKELGAWLLAHPQEEVTLEGHCDERGTEEYNLALGERRAESVRSYLVNLGVDPSRLKTISYGEERPVDPGHNEEAWAKNRRVEF